MAKAGPSFLTRVVTVTVTAEISLQVKDREDVSLVDVES